MVDLFRHQHDVRPLMPDTSGEGPIDVGLCSAYNGFDAREPKPARIVSIAENDQPHRKYPRIMIAMMRP